MIRIGQTNRLTVCKQVAFGVFLDGGQAGNILLPKRYCPAGIELGDELDVFLYNDSEDQLIATTETPKIQVGQCAYLKVKEVNQYGAFLDWGLSKDLFVPFKEQHMPMQADKSYVVTVYLERDNRLVASSRLSRHLDEFSRHFEPNQAVKLLVCGRSDMGYKTVVNHSHLALLFKDEAFKPLRMGQQVDGYIKSIREDGKINVSLQLPPVQQRVQLTQQIIQYLQAHGGTSTLTDKSAPDDIYNIFNVSKGAYKKALGQLYKERRITIEPDKITLT